MAKKLTDKEVLQTAGLLLSNEASVLSGLDYPTANQLRRKLRMLSRRLFEMAAKSKPRERTAL